MLGLKKDILLRCLASGVSFISEPIVPCCSLPLLHLTWAIQMFLAEELEASGLWSSETLSRLELEQRGQAGAGWGPGREVQADQEVAENSLGRGLLLLPLTWPSWRPSLGRFRSVALL